MTDSSAPSLLLARSPDGHVAHITLNRPSVRNALSREMARDLTAILDELGACATLRAVILTGAGDRAFCAGADLVERQAMTAGERSAHTEEIAAATDALAAMPVPTIAAIRGYALAGGAELAIACDLRVVAEDAIIGFPEVRVGIFPGAGGVVRLPRLIGSGPARDLLYTGRQIIAAEAFRLGLIDRLVPEDEVDAAADTLATTIAANAPLAIRALKRTLIESAGLPEAAALAISRGHRRPLDATADYREGLAAFAERRSPRFSGTP